MKTIFVILLAANLALAAWFMLTRGDPRDAHLIAQQIHPEKIKVISTRDKPPAAPPGDAAKAELVTAPKMLACVEWGGFAPADATRVEEALAPLAMGPKLSQRKLEENISWWVFIPPQPNRQAANQKAAELKSMGVDDFFIVSEDAKWRNAIQFGLFKSQEAANARLEQLRAKRVRSAQTGKRDAQISKVFFQMRDVPEAFAAKLADMKAMFPGSEVKPCAADETKAAP